jgi:homoserine kinase
MNWRVRVPATCANLGPGFDCLALAIDLWNDLLLSTEGDRLTIEIEGEGASHLPINEHNLIVRAMQAYARQHAKPLPAGIHLVCKNHIPPGSGLGSSAAATVAGILCATALLDLPDDKMDQLACAAEIEGHGDNAAACLLGGLTATMKDDNQVIARRLPIALFSLVVVTPAFRFPTRQARAALPRRILHSTAADNLAHAVLLAEALRSGDLELLRASSHDQLHQPQRLPLIPGAAAAMQASLSAGAAAVFLSGAGPSLLSITKNEDEREKIGGAMQAAFQQAGLPTQVFTPNIAQVGASVHK